MGKYYCEICNKVSKQKSHHEAHLESELHLTKVENFKLVKECSPDHLFYNSIRRIILYSVNYTVMFEH